MKSSIGFEGSVDDKKKNVMILATTIYGELHEELQDDWALLIGYIFIA